ncbi:MAG TPA: YceI family protein [Vicinamibacteria bacterium]|nr:YceI family protein [Vicinamibacteria bacterium]
MATRVLAIGLLLLPAVARAAEQAYVVDGAESAFRIVVGRSGLFSFAGHTHEVVASGIEGTIVADSEDLGRSSVTLRFPAAGLRVTGRGEPSEDVPKVQAKMEGPAVLDVARFAEIVFRSTRIEGRETGDVFNLRVTGELTLRGATRTLTLPLRATRANGGLEASGQVVLKQSDFGIEPISVAGVVKVKNELGCDYKIVGRLAP